MLEVVAEAHESVTQPRIGERVVVDNVLVVGAGPTGQLIAQMFRVGGASRAVVAAPTLSKLHVGESTGASAIVQTVRDGSIVTSPRVVVEVGNSSRAPELKSWLPMTPVFTAEHAAAAIEVGIN